MLLLLNRTLLDESLTSPLSLCQITRLLSDVSPSRLIPCSSVVLSLSPCCVLTRLRLQGETFEYVDLKKKYRYLSEQVSHHPPISACIAQAASWEYFGEVDAKSSFKGKSFEITPVGVAHVHLRIPKEWSPDSPPAPMFPGMVLEHYSWTKVTTSVSNFLFGSPIIDHFGEMVSLSFSLSCHPQPIRPNARERFTDEFAKR